MLGDILAADFGDGRDLAMLIFGEFNTFGPADASMILTKVSAALAIGGRLLLEVHTKQAVKRIGSAPDTRRSLKSGLFSDRPHDYVTQNFWDEATQTATTRYIVIDEESGKIERHAQTLQAYTDAEYREKLRHSGFASVEVVPSLTGERDDNGDLYGLIARRC